MDKKLKFADQESERLLGLSDLQSGKSIVKIIIYYILLGFNLIFFFNFPVYSSCFIILGMIFIYYFHLQQKFFFGRLSKAYKAELKLIYKIKRENSWGRMSLLLALLKVNLLSAGSAWILLFLLFYFSKNIFIRPVIFKEIQIFLVIFFLALSFFFLLAAKYYYGCQALDWISGNLFIGEEMDEN